MDRLHSPGTKFHLLRRNAYDWLTSWDQAIAAADFYGVPFVNIEPDPLSTNPLAPNNLTVAESVEDLPGPNPFDWEAAATEMLTLGDDDAIYYIDVVVPDDDFESKDGSTQDRIDAYEDQFGDRTSVGRHVRAARGARTFRREVGEHQPSHHRDVTRTGL